MATAEHAFVLRLTKPRFEALQRRATRLDGGDNGTMSSHRWCPSAKERKTPPDLPPEAALEVRLHEIILHNERTLYLVTDLPDDVERLADLDPRRVEIEADIRNLKVVLNAETIRARKIDTFLKELHASIVPVSPGQPATWSSNSAATPPNKPACRHAA